MIDFSWLGNSQPTVDYFLVLLLLAFSMHVAMRAGLFSVASVGFWAVGGYGTAIVMQRSAVPTAAVVLGTVVVALVSGALLGVLLTRVNHLSLTMVTVAFVLLIQVVALNWSSLTGGALGLFGLPYGIGTGGLLVVAIAVAAGVALYERGRSGRTLDALRLDDQLAQAVGIDIARQRVFAIALSSALGALGGSLNVLHLGLVTADEASFHLVVDALTMIIVGGTAAWYGPVIGALVLVWLPEILRFAGEWREVVQGLIVVLLVVYAPGGAVGLVQGLGGMVRGRRQGRVRPGAAVAT